MAFIRILSRTHLLLCRDAVVDGVEGAVVVVVVSHHDVAVQHLRPDGQTQRRTLRRGAKKGVMEV